MANILFIADFFADQVPGGGELNNKVLIEKLYKRGHTVRRVNSHLVNHMDLLYNENGMFSGKNMLMYLAHPDRLKYNHKNHH